VTVCPYIAMYKTDTFFNSSQEEVRLREKMRRKLDLGTRESDTVIDQMEEDMDLEVLEIKQKYELRLAEARDVGLRLKGENGIMKKKFNQLQKDIHEQKETILGLGDDKKQLRQTIGDLKKDLTGLRKELWDRDDTIGDKERRIYDLKKKTQELEKFKFVLDYKIKQLKKQIEPRELDVADMKTTIKQMDHELEKYHKSNAYLELSITDLKHKLVGVQKDEVKQVRPCAFPKSKHCFKDLKEVW
jgi:chromosome segregation ATPase